MDDISPFTETLGIHSIFPTEKNEWSVLIGFIKESDSEFTPPLFERSEFVFQLENGLNNHGLMAMEADTKLIAATLYETDHCSDKEKAYLTFFRVIPELRRSGIGFWFRQKLLDHLKTEGFKSVVTRTWSTNYPMLRLNEKTNFQRSKVIVDDRGPGIDTVYFKLDL